MYVVWTHWRIHCKCICKVQFACTCVNAFCMYVYMYMFTHYLQWVTALIYVLPFSSRRHRGTSGRWESTRGGKTSVTVWQRSRHTQLPWRGYYHTDITHYNDLKHTCGICKYTVHVYTCTAHGTHAHIYNAFGNGFSLVFVNTWTQRIKSYNIFYSFFKTVLLDRSIPALGMSIVGGVDYCSKLFGCGQPGIYISKVSMFAPSLHYTCIIYYIVCGLPLYCGCCEYTCSYACINN